MSTPGINRHRLVATVLVGWIAPLRLPAEPYVTAADGLPVVPLGSGGVCPTVRVGMPVHGWAAEQVEPAVSLAHPDPPANAALLLHACVGNRVEVQGGPADGAVGTVTGKHEQFAAFNHLLVDFEPAVLERLGPDARFVVQALGVGLRVDGLPSVACHSLSPELWDAWAPDLSDGRLLVRVAAEVPPERVGMGSGRWAAVTSLAIQADEGGSGGLDRLRIGDLVAIRDWDARHAAGYREGAITVGIVGTGSSRLAGQGCAVTVLLSCADGRLGVLLDDRATLAGLLPVGVAPG